MTRSADEVARALELATRGASASQIARMTGIPRPTVRDWFAGKTPRSERTGVVADPTAGLDPLYAYLLGLYLGDGFLARHARDVYRLRIFLDARYPGIVAEAETAMRAVRPRNPPCRMARPGHFQISSYSKAWPVLFPQHGPGMKHQRPIELANWQTEAVKAEPRLFVRGLIHSDGCRSINTGTNWRHPRYSFSNRSDDILALFEWGCELVGVRYTRAPFTVYVSRKADVARMDEFIGPKT